MNVQNVLNQKINKRIVKNLLKQSAKYNVDIAPVEQSTDLTSNYNFLMKTANLIYLYLSSADLTIKRDYANIQDQVAQDVDNDSANPFNADAFIPSIRSNRSRADTIGTLESSVPGTRSSYSSGSYGLSRASRPFYRPGSYQGSNASEPQSLPYNNSRINYPIPNYDRRIPPNPYDDDTISELSDNSYFPDLSEESFYQRNKQEGSFSINTTQLEREAVNLKFYTDQMLGQFNLLTKPQKERLRKIIIKVTNQINLINITQNFNPDFSASFKLIKSTFSTINDELTKSGEKSTSDSIEYEYDESVGAGRINKGIYQLHQPTKYVNPNNVNANFLYNLAQRNR